MHLFNVLKIKEELVGAGKRALSELKQGGGRASWSELEQGGAEQAGASWSKIAREEKRKKKIKIGMKNKIK